MATMVSLTRKERVEKAITLSERLLEESLSCMTGEEKKRQKMLSKMMEEEHGLAFLTEMTDISFRSSDDARTLDQLLYLIEKYQLPHFLPPDARLGLLFCEHWGQKFPTFFVTRLKKKIWKEMQPFFRQKGEKGELNVNHLGEAILGEREAQKRLGLYLEDLQDPDTFQISVKISTLYSQIHLLGWGKSLDVLKERYRRLLRGPKFVSLDMEEYKDLDLTLALFTEVLDEPEFANTSAGIVLQSYLPDAFELQQSLVAWAQKRSVPIKLRLVKGANLAMERVESSLRGWPQAPYEHKIETDANYLRMMEFGCEKEHARAVHLGIGSHNLFDIAYAIVLREENGVENEVVFEMLKGMAEGIHRAVEKRVGPVLLYTPDVKESDFPYAAPYLIRRLDENTAPENFLRHLFGLHPGSTPWDEQVKLFQDSSHLIDTLSTSRRRVTQIIEHHEFTNEPDTDYSLMENRRWASKIFEKWEEREIPELPSTTDVDKIFEGAKKWDVPLKERIEVLKKVAGILRERRGDLIGAMMAESSKVFDEADVEVSEAIDFVEYYRREGGDLLSSENIEWSPKGTLLVAPPWNFPVSIPVGGVAAALMGGNAVLLKPAPETPFLGWMVANAFWDGGVPPEVLQFVRCDDDKTGSAIVSDERLDGAILTGATTTAKHFLHLHPGLDLMAETGGKNALIITAMSDRDLAISDLLKSAFGHAGQKCSACSLLILEKELYDDPKFLAQLKDATESLIVDTPWNRAAKVPPMIHPPSADLFRLDEEESWLVEPKQIGKMLLTPGIKLGVKEGSKTHQTELFAPILGVMRAENLTHAIELANKTPYGLTSGLHSLDEREHELWQKKIVAGNLYINRTITGAVVRRQPFGGTKASGFGPGAKAGGPNYLFQMVKGRERKLPKASAPLPPALIPLVEITHKFLNASEMEIFRKSAGSYAYYAKKLMAGEDPSQVLGQQNLFYHVPHDKVTLRPYKEDSRLALFQSCAAALSCGTPLEISAEQQLFTIPGITWRIEDRKTFLFRVEQGHVPRTRLLHTPSRLFKEKAAKGFAYFTFQPVFACGRVELLHYLREVSLSKNTHRYGYIKTNR